MNKDEMRAILKPLIKECVRECILESGVLSTIITEVANGLANSRTVINEVKQTKEEPLFYVGNKNMTSVINESEKTAHRASMRKAAEEKQIETQKRLAKITGFDAFEGVTPLTEAQATRTPGSGMDPEDPGINIDSIFNAVSSNRAWAVRPKKG